MGKDKNKKHYTKNMKKTESKLKMNEQNNKDTENQKNKRKSIFSLIIKITGAIISVTGFSLIWLFGIICQPPPQITLSSEYNTIKIFSETNITATLNFEAESVIITAYLASGKSDTLQMNKKSSSEWYKRVYFNETGKHTIIATATTSDGNIIENSISIEVIPITLVPSIY